MTNVPTPKDSGDQKRRAIINTAWKMANDRSDAFSDEVDIQMSHILADARSQAQQASSIYGKVTKADEAKFIVDQLMRKLRRI